MTFDAAYWDERYAASESVWGAPPNRFVAAEAADLPPGRALDLACGEGRNAIWLHSLGWRVTAIDWSGVAVAKGRAAEPGVEWVQADVTSYRGVPADLVLVCYLQVPAELRHAAFAVARDAVAPGGTLLVVAHDSRNLVDGTGGPQDPAVLYTAADVVADLDGLQVEKAGEVLRPVGDAQAIDCLVRAVRAP